MQIYFYIGFAVLFILQAITTPLFLKAEIPNPCKKSLLWKMICSTIFIITAVLAMLCSKNYSTFTILMLIGFLFSWCGDFLLHVNQKPLFFILGLFSFLCGHIFYISAYTKAMSTIFPDAPFMGITEMIIYIVIVCVAIFTLSQLKVEFAEAYLPCLFYLSTIGVMIIKAFSLGIRLIVFNAIDNSILTAILLMVGSLLFLMSDYTLAILTFTKGIASHGKLRNFNIWTYFFGQMFLSMTILNIAS